MLEGIRSVVTHAKRLRESHRIPDYVIEVGQPIAFDLRLARRKDRPADRTELLDRFTLVQHARRVDHRLLGHAVEQKIRLGVEQDRPPHLVFPEIVMAQPPHRGFHTAQHNRHTGKSLARALRVHDHRAVGPHGPDTHVRNDSHSRRGQAA